MTREEAIDRLNRIAEKAVHTPGETPFVMSIDDGIAVHMAIEALQQPNQFADGDKKDDHLREVTKKVDTISRQAAIDSLHMHLMYRMGTDSNKKRLDEWINNLPSAQPEQLERCPIYGGVCGYPSDQCYECPRHSGAQPEQLIRCGDCKYKDDGIDEDGFPFLKCLHGRSYGGTRINDFCSWAERKEGESDG